MSIDNLTSGSVIDEIKEQFRNAQQEASSQLETEIDKYKNIFLTRGLEFTEGYLAGADPKEIPFSSELKDIVYKLANKMLRCGEGEDWIYKVAEAAHYSLTLNERTSKDVKEAFQKEVNYAERRAMDRYDPEKDLSTGDAEGEDLSGVDIPNIEQQRIDEFKNLFLSKGEEFTLGYIISREGKILDKLGSIYAGAELAYQRFQEPKMSESPAEAYSE